MLSSVRLTLQSLRTYNELTEIRQKYFGECAIMCAIFSCFSQPCHPPAPESR
jgi:hypothetical protein